MRFKVLHPKWGELPYVYEPKTLKLADQIMTLHRNMGDDILMLDDTDPEAPEVTAVS